jgi:hypothetical protein
MPSSPSPALYRAEMSNQDLGHLFTEHLEGYLAIVFEVVCQIHGCTDASSELTDDCVSIGEGLYEGRPVLRSLGLPGGGGVAHQD